MPGTPATTPRHAIPRIASTDTDDVPRDINAAVDRIDVTAPVFGSGLLSSRPSAGAGIADRYYYATDAVRPDGSTGVLYRDAGGASPTWSAVTPVAPGATVTSLPGSPVDGQVIDYLADATNGIVWRLRYRAASPSAYKWEYLGGSPMMVQNLAGLTTTSLSFVDPTGGSISLNAPLAGDYIAELHFYRVYHSAAGGGVSAGVAYPPDLSTPSSSTAFLMTSASGFQAQAGSIKTPPITLTAAGRTVKVMVSITTIAGTGTLEAGRLHLYPVRVG